MQIGRLKYDIFFKKIFHKKHILKSVFKYRFGPNVSGTDSGFVL